MFAPGTPEQLPVAELILGSVGFSLFFLKKVAFIVAAFCSWVAAFPLWVWCVPTCPSVCHGRSSNVNHRSVYFTAFWLGNPFPLLATASFSQLLKAWWGGAMLIVILGAIVLSFVCNIHSWTVGAFLTFPLDADRQFLENKGFPEPSTAC